MKRLFSLSPRLRAVADLVPPGARLVDIGTDHGRLPVWLAVHGVTRALVATDLREKPLGRARALAQRWGVSDRIDLRLGDGLTCVRPEEAEVIAVTGMGGETIADILHAVPWAGEGERTYLLQPMTGADGLRRYLSQNGFVIRREQLVEEGETLYVLLVAQPGADAPYSEGEIWAGRQRPGDCDPLRGRYLAQELGKLRWAAEGLERSQTPEDGERLAHFRLVAQEVEQMKKEWDTWQA